jgi:hypothetical protein
MNFKPELDEFAKSMDTVPPKKNNKGGCLKIGLLMIAVAIVTSIATLWVAKVYLFPKAFSPVHLNAREETVLNSKIEALTSHSRQSPGSRDRGIRKPERPEYGPQGELTPEPYSERDADREIRLTERELNGLLAKNTDLAKKLAIDLSDDLASAKLLLPLDPDLPFLGGKTLRVTAGMELRYADGRPVAVLRGVSVWGVPIPNEWLGGIKNIDLVREFGMDHGFWHTFAAGIEHIRVENGRLSIKLKP